MKINIVIHKGLNPEVDDSTNLPVTSGPKFWNIGLLLDSNIRSDVLMKDEHLFTFLHQLGHIL